MLRDSEALIRAGGSIVVLRKRDKRPVDQDWTTLPRMTWKEANERFPAGANIGLRLGEPSVVDGRYVHGIDLDIRDESAASEALAALTALVGGLDGFGIVRSGSGGSSRHFYFLSDRPIRTRKIIHSPDRIKGADGKAHWRWEIDLGGTGRQFVLPPSIHPITRKPYEWLTDIEWEDIRFIPASTVESWLPAYVTTERAKLDDHGDDLLKWFHAQPPRFETVEVYAILDILERYQSGTYIEDRDGWLTIGFALHNWSEGGDEGYEIWCSFASASDKFDEDDSRRVWRSFGKRNDKPLTMKTLLKRSQTAHVAEEYGLGSSVATTDLQEDDFGVHVVTSAPHEKHRERSDLLGDDPEDDYLEDRHHDALVKAARDVKIAEQKAESAWVNELDRTDTGVVKATATNLALIVAHDDRLTDCVALNQFTQQTVYRRAFKIITPSMSKMPVLDPVNGDLWSENHDVNLRLFLATRAQGRNGGWGLKSPNNIIRDAIVAASLKHPFHPVRNYLRSVKWDGVPRMDTLFERYLGTPKDDYYREVPRLMMLAAINRVMNPGCKFDFAVILEGGEGLRKSTFIRILAKDWFGELHGDFADRKGMVEQMMGVWIGELPELSGMQRSQVTTTKAFMSAREDIVRLAYASRAATFPRQCIFIGSTNDTTYLASETGNRRFLPIACTVRSIDTDALVREIDQVWAEAFVAWGVLFKRHGADMPLFLSHAASAEMAFKLQASRKMESGADIWAGKIEVWLETPDTLAEITGDEADKFDSKPDYLRTAVCSQMVWAQLGGENRQLQRQDQLDIAAAFRKLKNWRQAEGDGRLSFPKPFGQQRGFVRVDASPADIARGYVLVDKDS